MCDRLQWNEITGDGAKVLAKSLLRGTSLRYVALMGNQVDSISATWIVEASAVVTSNTSQISQADGENDGSNAGTTVSKTVYIDIDIPFNTPRSKALAAAEIESFEHSIYTEVDEVQA